MKFCDSLNLTNSAVPFVDKLLTGRCYVALTISFLYL